MSTIKKAHRKKIAIIGGGPSGMMAAIELSKHHEVHVYEKNKTLGRKFLVAGKGGFNLSNNLDKNQLKKKYFPTDIFEPIIRSFGAMETVNWLSDLGIPTYVGTSGRIFPVKGIKPIQVLNVLKKKIITLNGAIYFEHELIEFDSKQVTFKHKNKVIYESYDICILALGGASWPITGSKGDWIHLMQKNNIKTTHFEPSNCGLEMDFNGKEIAKYVGRPLKNIRVTSQGITIKGEAIISKYGLEGNAIYPISRIVRKQLNTNNNVFIELDLKPFNTEKELLEKLTPKTTSKNYGYLFKLNKVQIALIKSFTSKETYINPITFAKSLKNILIPIKSLRPINEAISTVGGVNVSELNSNLGLKKFPNVYIAGEMFDWDTITGGFLLQGCFATGYHIAKDIILKNTKH
jgi:uncharacterized flavoprotein (TIGR03862 family)